MPAGDAGPPESAYDQAVPADPGFRSVMSRTGSANGGNRREPVGMAGELRGKRGVAPSESPNCAAGSEAAIDHRPEVIPPTPPRGGSAGQTTPPSTMMVCPVTMRAPDEASHSAQSAMSEGRIKSGMH